MDENDPMKLADARQREADDLESRSERLAGEVKETRTDWERKRADDNVPGAPPLTDIRDAAGQHPSEAAAGEQSPAPQAPPPEEGPAAAETPPEGATGDPADTVEEAEER
jgi:hypothetical protein